MKRIKSTSWLLVVSFLLTVLLFGCGAKKQQTGIPAQADPKKTRVIMLDIGQGDSMLIQANGKNILVDASKIDTRKELLAKLEHYKVTSLDLVIATHAHEDHIGGMDAVFNKIPVKEVFDAGVPSTSKLYHNYLLKIKEKKIKLTVPKAGSKIDLGQGVYLEFFTPLSHRPEKDNTNNTSLVFKLVDSKFSMLFTGDIEKEGEKLIVEKYSDKLRSDVLKAPHHGSSTSSSQQFLDRIKAGDVLVSCAAGNDYKHPHESVVKRYQKNKMNMYITHQSGDIAITATDKGYSLTTSK